LAEDAYELYKEARMLLQEHHPDMAVSLLQRAKSLEPRRGSILEALGIAYYNSGNHAEAMREFEEALEIDPTNHYARYALSRCMYRKGMLKMAIGQAKLAVVMAPEIEMYVEAMDRYQREIDANKGK
jgi:tetratricopeptide (TPR) repeat protein